MAETKSDRTKPHYNIDTIGHADHGKTTPTAAITRAFTTKLPSDTNKIVDFENIDKAPEERECSIAISAAHVECETRARHYAHVDCPGHAGYAGNMIIDAAQVDGATLVVAATGGVVTRTREYILLVCQVNVPYTVVFMGKCDMVDDEELLDLVEMKIRELLNDYSFPGDDVLIVCDSVLKVLEGSNGLWGDRIMDLVNAVDEATPGPEHENDKPFLMPVEGVFTITGHGTAATSRVERGTLKLNDEVESIGIKDEDRKTVVTGIEMFRKLLDYAEAGDSVGFLFRGINREDIPHGQVLVKPGMVTCYTKFTAQVYTLIKDEDGRHTLFFNNYRSQFYFRAIDVVSVCVLPEGTKMHMPGDDVEMTVELIHPIAMEQGLRFAIHEGGRIVGSGGVVKIIE